MVFGSEALSPFLHQEGDTFFDLSFVLFGPRSHWNQVFQNLEERLPTLTHDLPFPKPEILKIKGHFFPLILKSCLQSFLQRYTLHTQRENLLGGDISAARVLSKPERSELEPEIHGTLPGGPAMEMKLPPNRNNMHLPLHIDN